MSHLKESVLLFLFLSLLQCVSTVPKNRFSISSFEQADDVPMDEGWMDPGMSLNPFLRFVELRSQRGLAEVDSQQHHIEKRRCNTATCVTQRLADFLIRSSNTIGTVYAPTNVGSSAYGKRNLLQSDNSLTL